MQITLIVAGSLIGLALLVTVAGLFLPREHTSTSEIALKQPIDSVYAVLRDIGGMPAWWKDLKTSERIAGAPSERWRQDAGGFKMELDVTDIAPPFRFSTKIVEEKGAPFGGVWLYALNPAGAGTTVTITEKGWIGPPPFRVMAHLTGLNRTLDSQLEALAKHFGEDAKPVHK